MKNLYTPLLSIGFAATGVATPWLDCGGCDWSAELTAPTRLIWEIGDDDVYHGDHHPAPTPAIDKTAGTESGELNEIGGIFYITMDGIEYELDDIHYSYNVISYSTLNLGAICSIGLYIGIAQRRRNFALFMHCWWNIWIRIGD